MKVSFEKIHLEKMGLYIQEHYKIIILTAIAFVVMSIINFTSTATGRTIASFRISDFEVGQIADRTIIATNNFAQDERFPVDIKKGDLIIKKGFPITDEQYFRLKKMSDSPLYIDYKTFFNTETYLFILTVLWFLLFSSLPKNKKNKRIEEDTLKEYIFQVCAVALLYLLIEFGYKTSFFSASFSLCIIIPVALFSLLESILYGRLNAVLFSIILSFVVFGAANYQVVPFVFSLIISLTSAVIVSKIEHRIDMVFVALLLMCVSPITIFLLHVIFNKEAVFLPITMGGVAANGFLSGILALGLITPLEFILNTASIFRLMDLSDQNNPILKKMLLVASGTYQHSLMVSQLAEAACNMIGGNALLARVGAYYHDIGKMDQPEYFIENQSNGINKHDLIKPSLSASVLRNHVKKGIEKGRQLHLPEEIIDIISEHHGNSVMAYFYEEAKKTDSNVNISDFSYPGSPPSTKESAVVMLSDTVEAACRSLDEYTEESISSFIQKLISGKISHNQLDNSDLTFSDITKIQSVFTKVLLSHYHTRIKYPDQKGGESSDKRVNNSKVDSNLVGGARAEKKHSDRKNKNSADKELGKLFADKEKEGE